MLTKNFTGIKMIERLVFKHPGWKQDYLNKYKMLKMRSKKESLFSLMSKIVMRIPWENYTVEFWTTFNYFLNKQNNYKIKTKMRKLVERNRKRKRRKKVLTWVWKVSKILTLPVKLAINNQLCNHQRESKRNNSILTSRRIYSQRTCGRNKRKRSRQFKSGTSL